jgi:imidazoleglycerol-phosphate dehydratase/histidinol-phosphatase
VQKLPANYGRDFGGKQETINRLKKYTMKKVLFIDRDGTLIKEPEDEQIDAFEKLEFYPGVFQNLGKIAKELDFEIVMVTNQDGLGTNVYPEDTFWPVHNFIMACFEAENIHFEAQFIDRTFPSENADTRKPKTGLLTKYFGDDYSMEDSYVIGDRLTDIELAKNLGAQGIYINTETYLGTDEITVEREALDPFIALETNSWKEIYSFLKAEDRTGGIIRNTNETKIAIQLNLDGTGRSDISTGIAFFDHMLDQLARHGQLDLNLKVDGDLEVDEHHTIEDTAIALGELFSKVLGDKLGIERYGFCLPMDDCLAQAAIDFGGRNWLVWEADFKREMIGKMPTEMFMHFFKSFTDGAKCNLNIKAQGTNEHHKIEAIFKAFAKAIKMAVKRDVEKMILPSTKGML